MADIQIAEVSTSEGVEQTTTEALRIASVLSSESIASPDVTQTLRVAKVQSSESIIAPAYDEGATNYGIDTETLRITKIQTSESMSQPTYDESGTQYAQSIRIVEFQTSESVVVTPQFYLFGLTKYYLTNPVLGII